MQTSKSTLLTPAALTYTFQQSLGPFLEQLFPFVLNDPHFVKRRSNRFSDRVTRATGRYHFHGFPTS